MSENVDDLERIYNLEITDLNNEVHDIISARCTMCHAKEPLLDNMKNAPKLVNLETPTDIINNIDNIYKQSVLSYAMPPGNISFLEDILSVSHCVFSSKDNV